MMAWGNIEPNYVTPTQEEEYQAAEAYFLREFVRVGGFHPDDDPAGLVHVNREGESGLPGKPCFTDQEARKLRHAIETVRRYGVDPSTLSHPVAVAWGWMGPDLEDYPDPGLPTYEVHGEVLTGDEEDPWYHVQGITIWLTDEAARVMTTSMGGANPDMKGIVREIQRILSGRRP